MSDNADAIVYLLRRWKHATRKATAIYSVRGRDGEWRHTDVYTDHHATCPEAAAWKGKRR